MLPSLPNIDDYQISAENGFLPAEPPLMRLPDPYYEPWELIVDNLQTLLSQKQIRCVVDSLPLLSTGRLGTESEWRRAYSVLGYISNSYIWGEEQPKDRIPKNISIPFLEISEHLELPPVVTYAGLCLWNYRPVYRHGPIDILENITTLTTFTGSIDESWFYLVSVAIEARGAPLIPLMIEAMGAVRRNDALTVTECLTVFAERIMELRDLLGRMYDHCSAKAFYYRIRPFLAGSKNMGGAGLPNGVILEDGTGTEEYRQYAGGSNAQSSLIQFFDIVLGVEHRPTGIKKDPSDDKLQGTAPPPKHNFIEEMRSYMPGPHRRFLEHLTSVANIRPYVEANPNNVALSQAFDECIRALSSFRDKHIQIVSRYIVIMSADSRRRAAEQAAAASASSSTSSIAAAAAASVPTLASAPPIPAIPSSSIHSITPGPTSSAIAAPPEINLGLASGFAAEEAKKNGLKGTGGTQLMPFLKQSRDETMEAATGINSWSRPTTSKTESFQARRTWDTTPPASVSPASTPRRCNSPSIRGFAKRSCKINDFEDQPVTRRIGGVGMAVSWDENDDVGGICHY